MNLKEFNDHPYTSKTRVKLWGYWYKIRLINFEERFFYLYKNIGDTPLVDYKLVEDIK